MATEGYVTTQDGVRLFFVAVGDGAATILFPNGLYLFDDFAYLASKHRIVFYDVRNRGRSDAVADRARLERGIQHDVDDIDCVRRHFNADRTTVIGHSYVGVTAALYAMRYATRVDRVVQIGPMPPNQATVYPPELSNEDETLRNVLAAIAELQKERPSMDPVAFCEKFWATLRPIYVADPADAGRIKWSRCDLPNERNFMKPMMEYIMPSIQRLALGDADFAAATAPVLTIHGTKDRSAPYGAGRDWARRLPNARLLTVTGAAHAPWIEAPDRVFDAVSTFFDGNWPADAEKVS